MKKRLLALLLSTTMVLSMGIMANAEDPAHADPSSMSDVDAEYIESEATVVKPIIGVTIAKSNDIFANPYGLSIDLDGDGDGTEVSEETLIGQTITITNATSNVPVQIKLYGKVALPAVAQGEKASSVSVGTTEAAVKSNVTSRQVYVQAVVTKAGDPKTVLATVSKNTSTKKYTFTAVKPLVYTAATTTTTVPAKYGAALSTPIVIGTAADPESDTTITAAIGPRDKYDATADSDGDKAECVSAIDIVISGATSTPATLAWRETEDKFTVITTFDVQIGKAENMSAFLKPVETP